MRWARCDFLERRPIATIHSRWIAPSTSVSSQSSRVRCGDSFCDGLEVGVVGKGDGAGRQSDEAVIHRLQQESVKVDEVACDMNGGDLAAAIGEKLVAGSQSLDEQRTVGRPGTGGSRYPGRQQNCRPCDTAAARRAFSSLEMTSCCPRLRKRAWSTANLRRQASSRLPKRFQEQRVASK